MFTNPYSGILHLDLAYQTTCSPTLGTPSSDGILGYPSHFDVPITQDDYYSYHCHWNHCDYSFSSFFDFDEHLLDSHIPQTEAHIPQTEAPVLPVSMFQCQWDECQTTAPSETELVQHVKQTHLPDSSKEHHQCRWVHENGFPRV